MRSILTSHVLTGSLGADVNVTTDLAPPSTFHFPTEREYLGALSRSTKSLVDLGSYELTKIISPPANSSVKGLITLVESTSGSSLAEIISGRMLPNAPAQVTEMMTNLLNGALDVVIAGVSKAAAELLVGIIDVIPVLGTIVGAAIGIIRTIADAADGAKINPQDEQWVNQLSKERYNECLQLVCATQNAGKCRDVRETGYNPQLGVHRSIADTFRPFAYALHEARPAQNGSVALPFCGILFPLAAMCGAETGGAVWKNRGEYDSFVRTMRIKYNDPKLGIPVEIQRRMWSLFTSICKSTNDPRMSAENAPIGDGGRSLFPLLVDLSWSFCNDNSRRSAWLNTNIPGHWTIPFLKDMVAYHAPVCSGSASASGIAATISGKCSDHVDIVGGWDQNSGLAKLFSNYDIQLKNGFGAGDGVIRSIVTNRTMLASLKSVQKKGAVVIRPTRSSAEVIALVATSIGGSYLAWDLVRRIANRHK
jgi:hypothetical protein